MYTSVLYTCGWAGLGLWCGVLRCVALANCVVLRCTCVVLWPDVGKVLSFPFDLKHFYFKFARIYSAVAFIYILKNTVEKQKSIYTQTMSIA